MAIHRTALKFTLICTGLALIGSLQAAGREPPKVKPLPLKVTPAVPDAVELLSLADIHIDGWLGKRIDANEKNRLLAVDTVPLLAGYHKRPGTHPWIGEHIGKWMHAATLAWAYSGDPALRTKLDRAAAELISCQEADGYLGTYEPLKRFGLYPGADWDVWSHKYNMLGLLTYYEYTGNKPALEACRKMADLLIATFPTKRSILAAGTHQGMAATSVLEPIVLLYRHTGERRYLDFARYIVDSWDEPGGPRILASLVSETPVNKTANGKAYEMLSNLVGLCELYRVSGDWKQLRALKNAWQDIVDHRLYITGSASSFEHFQGDHRLPNDEKSHICETCVTVTWLQLNLQLLRLTGEAKYGDELERTLYNHLTAAQQPNGRDWAYYTPLEGKKPYDAGITCCHSSGPRGLALAPQTAYLRGQDKKYDVLVVDTFESSRATLLLETALVTVEQTSEFPLFGRSKLKLHLKSPASFGVKFRVPSWAVPLELQGADLDFREEKGGWLEIPRRTWRDGDQIRVNFGLTSKRIVGDHDNQRRAAITWGPFVLALDRSQNRSLTAKLDRIALAASMPSEDSEPNVVAGRGNLIISTLLRADGQADEAPYSFVPFADAGREGGEYRVWLRAGLGGN